MKKVFYLLLVVALTPHGAHAEKKSSIGYDSVEDALGSLRTDPAANVQVQDGWTIVSTQEGGNYVLWSFTPDNHPAHPAAVKRIVVKRDGNIYIDMKALCQASKVECDKLIAEFKELNKRISQDVQGGT